MSALRKLLIGVVVLLALLIGVAVFLPSEFHVERSLSVDAPVATVFEAVDTARSWRAWEPTFGIDDPTLEHSYEGPARGVGAVSAWSGERFGQGRQVVVASTADEQVSIDVFVQGRDTPTRHSISFEATARGTGVTWNTSGDVGWLLLARYRLGAIEDLMARDIDARLEGLKAYCEQAAATGGQDGESDSAPASAPSP